MLERIHEVSAITHAHPRSKMGTGMYALVVRNLLKGLPKKTAVDTAIAEAQAYYGGWEEFKSELPAYERIFSGSIASFEEDDIQSSGYIVHTLEAALWCLLRYNDTREILLAAVNLGLDTDTTGTVAGGLAGLTYGLEGVPADWLQSLLKKADIDALVGQFASAASTRLPDESNL
jgi:ADP-ribosylglycohydrolase